MGRRGRGKRGRGTFGDVRGERFDVQVGRGGREREAVG